MSISGSSFDSFNRHLLIGCRPRKHMQASHLSDASTADTVREPVARDWLWKPWYAKLWWAAIPVYWAGAAVSLKLPALAEFYTSALAGYTKMLFFPLTTLLVLGFGFIRAVLRTEERRVGNGVCRT